MQIIEFVAENFMKLKAVRIRPEGANMITLTGTERSRQEFNPECDHGGRRQGGSQS